MFENRLKIKKDLSKNNFELGFFRTKNYGREVIIFPAKFLNSYYSIKIFQSFHKMSQNNYMRSNHRVQVENIVKNENYDHGLSPLLMQKSLFKIHFSHKNVI